MSSTPDHVNHRLDGAQAAQDEANAELARTRAEHARQTASWLGEVQHYQCELQRVEGEWAARTGQVGQRHLALR